MLSYLLTPAGRKNFSRRITRGTLTPKPDYSSMFSCGKMKEKEEIESIVEVSLENIDFPQEPDDYSDELDRILVPLDDDDDDDYFVEEEEDEYDYIPAFDETMEEEEDESEMENSALGFIAKERMLFYPAQQFLKQIFINWGIEPISRQRVIDTFNSFISNKNDVFKDQDLDNGDYFWQHIRQTSPIWDTLGEIACRLHCSPCSEASCERTIST